MRVLVTGGAGFIGSHLVDRLLELGHRVCVVDNLSSGKLSNLNGHAKFYQMSVEDKKLAEVFAEEKPEIVFHLAAQISVSHSIENIIHDANVNIVASLNMLDNCVRSGVKKFIYFSTAAVYGDADIYPIEEDFEKKPLSPYGLSKLTTEAYIRFFHARHGLKYVIFRPANTFGPRQTPEGEAGVISIFLNKLLSGAKPTIFGDGLATRDFIYVKDLVEANIAAMSEDICGTYNASTDTEISILDLYDKLKTLSGSTLQAEFGPARKGDIARSRLSNKRLLQDLKFAVRHSFDEALAQTFESYRQNKLNEGVWLVVAAFNESKRIPEVLKSLGSLTANVVVVDDFSTDETAKVCSNFHCHYLRHPGNFGQGAALQSGMEYALSKGAKVIVHFDGDGQMQIKDIAGMVEPILNGQTDVVFGSRFLGKKDNVPLSKKWLVLKPAIYLNWLISGLKLTDAHCGFRALSAEATRLCVFKQNRMAHATEILELVRHHGLRFQEVSVDITYHHYGQGFLRGFRIIRELINAKFDRLQS